MLHRGWLSQVEAAFGNLMSRRTLHGHLGIRPYVRAPGWNRTSANRRRRTVLFALSNERKVRVPGVDPGLLEGIRFAAGCSRATWW